MSVRVTKTGGHSAEITWDAGDDPHGWLAKAVETDRLAYALEALGGTTTQEYTEEQALEAAWHTTEVSRFLAARAAVMVVGLRDTRGLSWRQIAARVQGDDRMQSSARRQYEAGQRQLGFTDR